MASLRSSPRKEGTLARDGVVKSAGRVFQLLEFFSDVKRPAAVMEIARALDIPQSSTSALLQSLVALGYCDADPAMRTYVPSARVPLLGAWLSAPLVEHGPLIRLLEDVAEATGEHTLLAALIGPLVRFIYTIAAATPDRPYIRTGTMRLLGRSGAGKLFLSARNDGQIAALVRRVNAEERNAGYRIDLRSLMVDIAVTRSRGYSVSHQPTGIGGVNVLLPRLPKMQPIAVAISAPSEIIDAHHGDFYATIRDATHRHLGMDLPGLADDHEP